MRKYFILWILFQCFNALAQEEEIRLKQRAIFIYNFAQQVLWPGDSELDAFNIGVLGDDPVLRELDRMKNEGRTIRGRSMEVKRILRLPDINQYQLVYLNKKYNFELEEVLRFARDHGVLIVSEGYGFNESMVNIIETTDGFQFELNETRLNVQGFLVGNALKESAITTGERWQELYQQSSRSLEEERVRTAEQQVQMSRQEQLIANQNKRINDQLSLIDTRNVQVEELQKKINDQNKQFLQLQAMTEAQQREFEEKEQKLNALEEDYQQQTIAKQEEIAVLDSILEAQKQELSNQVSQIRQQGKTLQKQRQELNAQKWFTILFAGIAFLAFLTIFFFWRGYRIKRKANKDLAEKNIAIESQARKIAQKSQEMEQFAYIASHDLQEPLNTITGSISLIDPDKLDDVGKYSLQFIDSAINRMRKMIQGLLEHSKLGAEVEFQQVDSNQILQQVETNLQQKILDKEAVIQWGNLPMLYGHEVELILLFQNLIGNALKFTKQDELPEVHISAEARIKASEKFWLFRVRDNGIGIDPAQHHKVFGMFQRVNSRSAYEGSGIGLAHCKKIVELHGGKIWVDSQLGQGSTFNFTIRNSMES